MMTRRIVFLIIAATFAGHAVAESSTTFTYQGRLLDGGVPASGSYNIDVSLWDALSGGGQISSTIVFNGLAVADGLFTVQLDFGASAFDNAPRWLEISVNGGELTPRQPITRAPYAIQTRGILVDENNRVGIGTTSPQHLLHVVGDAGTAHAIYGRNTETTSASAGVYGESNSSRGYGVFGFTTSNTGNNYGVYGRTNSSIGRGVYGRASLGSGLNYGVYGQSQSNSGTGVYGWASSNTGNTTGVLGRSDSPTGFAGRFQGRGYFSGYVGFGVLNPLYQVHAKRNSGTAIFGEGQLGVHGLSSRADGVGVFGDASNSSGATYGVYGLCRSNEGTGVRGYNTSGTGSTYGVRGRVDSVDGRGVFGHAATAVGENFGVYGRTDSDAGFGVFGRATAATGLTYGVFGRSDSSEGRGVGGLGNTGVYGNSLDQDGRGVYGKADSTSGITYGVYGEGFSEDGYGVFGLNRATSGLAFGVYGRSDAQGGRAMQAIASSSIGTGIGIYASCNSPSGFDFYAGGAGVDYGSSSSIRWKSNVRNIDQPLEKISRLRGVYFDWDEEHGGHHDVGMIAEEVGAVLPEIVNYEENGIDASGMDYSRLTPLLVEAVNALRVENDARIDALRAEIDALHAENDALRARLDSLERLVNQISTEETEAAR